MKDYGYIVVRKPDLVGLRWGDTLKIVSNAKCTEIKYRGLDRDQWLDVYDRSDIGDLSAEEKQLADAIYKEMSIYKVGVCKNFYVARQALKLANRDREANELIFVRTEPSQKDLESENIVRKAGYDIFFPGFGSPVRLGLFTQPDLFPTQVQQLNAFGLFDSIEALNEYVLMYTSVCDTANLEPIVLAEQEGIMVSIHV